MGWILAIFRRLFGGGDSKFDFLEQRGVQMIICILAVFCWELYKGFIWWKALAVAIFVYIFFCKGHYYYFMCGTEDDAYIDEQEAKGRKPAMNWIVAPVNKWLGFAPRSVQYCFVGLMIRYVIWSFPVSAFVGLHFTACAFCVPFIYNAMFWCKLPNWWLCKSPTNWAEFYTGLAIGYALY